MKLGQLQGETLAGRFRLEELLGQGGYGAVFQAVQISVGRRCAVKVLFPHLCEDEATVQRFRTEAKTTSRLTHPNTVVLYDFGRDDELGLLFLAMELLDGSDLTTHLRAHGPLSPAQTVHVIEQAAGSLQEAHDLGLVHRDIKPRNIMLLDRGNDPNYVKVIDFGIAKVVQSNFMTVSDVTRTGTVIGTPKYMSPEQIRDGDIDGRTDMYALAISAYHMLTGRTPFEEGTALEIAGRQLAERPQPPSRFRSNLQVSEAFETVLLKALEKRPEDRFETVTAFAEALREAVSQPSTPSKMAELTPTAPELPAAQAFPVDDPYLDDYDAPLLSDQVVPDQMVPDQVVPDGGVADDASGDQLLADGPAPDVATTEETIDPPPMADEAADVDRACDTDEASPESIEETGADSSGRRGPRKTLATMAIPNPARPDARPDALTGGRVSSGTTAEVAAPPPERSADGGTETIEAQTAARGLPTVAALVAAVLVALGAVLWMWPSADEGTSESVEQRQAAKADEQALAATAPPAQPPGATAEEGAKPTAERAAVAHPAPSDSDAEPRADEPAPVEAKTGAAVAAQAAEEPSTNGQGDDAADDEPDEEAVEAADESARPAEKKTHRAAYRSVSIRVIPWGTLYVDGREVGSGTRHRVRLREGRHRLILKQSGQVRARRTVDVTSGSSKIIELVAR